MSQLTMLNSPVFWDEMIKRSPTAEWVEDQRGRLGLLDIVIVAFELKAEYDAKMKEAQ